MSLNFFRADCQYPSIAVNSFGLCDRQDGTKAYPDTVNPDTWIGEVKNDNNLQIVFTAIDKCVLQDNEYEGRGRCDGMLTTDIHLYLVELNNTPKDWQTKAKYQLLSTIEFLLQNHKEHLNGIKKKKAFACNKKRKHFAFIDNEENLSLYNRTGFRIDIQAEIVVL